MNALPPKNDAINHTRMVLVKAGLTEDEADRFIQRLTGEVTAGALGSQDERMRFVEQQLAKLEQAQLRAHGSSADLRAIVIGVVSSLVANVVYDAGKSIVQTRPTGPLQAPQILPPVDPSRAAEIIRVEWACSMPTPNLQLPVPTIDGLMRALHRHDWEEGTLNPITAVYLDGIGMFLDRRGNHRRAERLRRQAIKISQKVNGPAHQSTGAALSNLGVCLASQRKYTESYQLLTKAIRILTDGLGTNHVQTAGAIFNLFECLYVQGRLLHVKLPSELVAGLPETRRFGTGMNSIKAMLVLLISLRNMCEHILELSTR